MKTCLFTPLLLLLFYSFTLLLTPKSASAAELKSGDVNLHTWTQISGLDLVSSLTCQIIGYDPAKPGGSGCVFYDQSGRLASAETPGGGAVAFTGNLIAALYANPPASGVQYLADLGKNLGIVKPAYAQTGTGWTGLQPILPIWKVFRNIAYLFFTIIFIAIGFAIMFRVKISPQAVVTIQSAIPRIVLALILVTFSYAIAGFLIDLMYVLMLLLAVTFKSIPEFAQFATLKIDSQVFGENIIKAFWGLPGLGGAAIATPAGAIKDIITALMGHFPIVSQVVGGVAGGLAALIIAVAIVYSLFRLFFSLLMAYISVIIAVILAPFQIMLDAIPGQSGFGNWLRNLIANLAVFPTTLAMLFIAGLLIESVAQGTKTQEGWVAPFLGGGYGGAIPALIGLGMILMTPKVVDMVKEALKVPPFKYGTAIGEAVGWGAGGLRAAVESGYRATPFAKQRELMAEAEKKARTEALIAKHPEWSR